MRGRWQRLTIALGLFTVIEAGAQERPDPGLTAVPGIRVGQVTLQSRPTGCTVVLADGGATGGVDVRGGAPASRETDLLRPENLVDRVHAVVLTGGSAFGLDAAAGVMRVLEQRGEGFEVRGTVVPIVVGASLLDLGLGHGGLAEESEGRPLDLQSRPDAACGERAALAASSEPVVQGSVGAGAGATVGKLRGVEHAMKGGVGSASLRLPDGLIVAALVAVNALGDVVDPETGALIAGVRGDDGVPIDARKLLLREGAESRLLENTTLAVVATNAALDKAGATRLAQMAQDGLARALVPVHTPYDGDSVFALATGRFQGEVDPSRLGALAAEVTARAIVSAVREAEGLPGIPSVRDLAGDEP